MCGIIYHLQPVSVRYFLNGIDIYWLAIAMNRHDGSCPWRNRSLYLFRIYSTCFFFDINEYGCASIPPDAMSRRHETIWRCYNLSFDIQCLEGSKQWKGTIGEKADIRYFQIFRQRCFQSFMEGSVVGNPFALPNLFEHFIKLSQIRKQR